MKKPTLNDIIMRHIREYDPRPTPAECFNNMIQSIGEVIKEDLEQNE